MRDSCGVFLSQVALLANFFQSSQQPIPIGYMQRLTFFELH